MTERTNITNLLLLTILSGFLLLSGGLQCAFDCLYPVEFSYKTANRVDNCHPFVSQPEQGASCQNKASHQTSHPARDLGRPEIHISYTAAQPLLGSSRLPAPAYRTGDSFELPSAELQAPPILLVTGSKTPLQSLSAISSIVLIM